MLFAGPLPQPIGKQEFVALQTALAKAMPDWNFHEQDFKQNGDIVAVSCQITGTQKGELNLPMPGFQKLPPTGKHVSLVRAGLTFTVKDGKISRIESANVPGSGVPDILAQLGLPMPQM